MKPIYRRCCGIDVHKKSVSVCVLPPEGQQGIIRREKFRTFLRDLKRLRAWLKNCQVTEVAMESTGQYWRPVWNVLEGHIAHLVLLNPAHVKGLAGRKTDRRDSRGRIPADHASRGRIRRRVLRFPVQFCPR